MIIAKKIRRPANPSCSAVVCAYNEECHLAYVLDGLLASSRINEIIVVDDGSTDGTAEIMRRYGKSGRVRPVFIAPNEGKGNAMAEGSSLARGDILLFVDADLVNWGSEYVDLVLEPLLSGKADMSIGFPYRGDLFWDRFDPFHFQRWIAGERAVWRSDLLPLIAAMRASRFGVETLINMNYKTRHVPVSFVKLRGLVHPIKFEKSPLAEARAQYLQEVRQILFTHLRHPIYTLMTTIPDLLDLRDAALAVLRFLHGRFRGGMRDTV